MLATIVVAYRPQPSHPHGRCGECLGDSGLVELEAKAPTAVAGHAAHAHHDVALLQHEVRCLRAVLFTKRSTVRVECQAQADPLLALTQLYACVTLNALSGLGFSADG